MNNFNIRTYACVIKDNSVLGLFEEYCGDRFLRSPGGGIQHGDILLKFPGGGLEYGEGLLDCLHREFKEELDIEIEVVDHFYTQDCFINTHFNDGNQLLSVYYMAKILNEEKLQILCKGIDKVGWIPLNQSKNPFSLQSDQIVFNKLKEKFL